MRGFIKLHRQLIEWEWYQDMNVKATFLHLILTVNFKDKRWKGILIKRGQILTSLQHLANDIGISVQKLRTALLKLEDTNEITRESTSLYTLITLCNFDSYQDKDLIHQQASNKPSTSEQQASNKPSTSEQQLLKNVKNVKKDKNVKNKFPYIANFQKIKKGELLRVTQLDKNFDLNMFPDEWTEHFQNEILKFWRYMESKKSDRWGVIGTISSQLSAIKSYLNDFSELEIIKSFKDTVSKSNVSWNPAWTLKRLGEKSEKDSEPKKFPYPLPKFLDAEDRQSYFYVRYNSYKPHLDIQKVNTIYKKRALYEKDAEGLCFELELKFPKLAEMQIQYNRLT
jgi:CTP-dependent riboflavin kinase